MAYAAARKPVAPQEQAASEIGIGSMTCPSCMGSVEKKLGRVESVTDVSMNLATEKARISFADPRTDTQGS